jgi:hypothetical protein
MFPLFVTCFPMTFDAGDILALLSAVLAGISAYIARQAVTRSLRPVLVFVCDKQGWFVNNVGTGPALDVLVARKGREEESWRSFVRLPPISKDGQIRLGSGSSFLAVTYTDAEGVHYSTTCWGYRNQVHKRAVFSVPERGQIALCPDLPVTDSRT